MKFSISDICKRYEVVTFSLSVILYETW